MHCIVSLSFLVINKNKYFGESEIYKLYDCFHIKPFPLPFFHSLIRNWMLKVSSNPSQEIHLQSPSAEYFHNFLIFKFERFNVQVNAHSTTVDEVRTSLQANIAAPHRKPFAWSLVVSGIWDIPRLHVWLRSNSTGVLFIKHYKPMTGKDRRIEILKWGMWNV